jgi:hypothetical protein
MSEPKLESPVLNAFESAVPASLAAAATETMDAYLNVPPARIPGDDCEQLDDLARTDDVMKPVWVIAL